MTQGESFVYTCCPGWGDHEFCAIKTIVKDGKIVRTEKPSYTGAEANEGYICQKGIMSCRQPYNPKRLLHPLKRAGERGEGKWEEISWDQALDEIAAKLLQLRDDYGPESLAMWNVVASVPPSQGLAAVLSSRFMGLWGATDPIQGYGLDNGPFYAAFFDMGDFYKYMRPILKTSIRRITSSCGAPIPSKISSALQSTWWRRVRTALRSSTSGFCSTARRALPTSLSL